MRQRVTTMLAGGFLAGVLTIGGPLGGAAAQSGVVTPGVSFAPTDQVIVRMRAGYQADAAALGRAAGVTVRAVRMLTPDTIVLRLPGSQADAQLRTTVTAMARTQGVAWAEPDVRMTALTNDPSWGQQWDLGPAGPSVYGIDVSGAWSALPASPTAVTVAVVDTGYLPHQDLAGAFAPGYDFIGDVQVANDGDGRDANASDPGDWVTSAETRSGYFRGCTASNSSWHGTHVSGTIGARTNNGIGIAGINPAVKILPVRVLGKCGGYTSDITDGVRWAAGLPVSGVPANPSVAKVVNLSLGGSGACPAAWQSAVDAVTAAGTVVVVAAGNSNADAANYAPASCNGVVTVASTGKAGNRAYYSNYGSTVEIAAPGGDKNADAGDTILSTLNSGTTTPGSDTYAKYQGTSMATPHVAGVVSLMLAANPSLTPGQVTQILQQAATPFPTGSTCATGCGAGIVNAAAAVTQAVNPPPPPTTTTVQGTVPGAFTKLSPSDGRTGIKGSVTLSWAASTGATQYWVCLEITANPDGSCTTFASGPYTGTSIKFVGLASGATYEWEVEARNAVGATEASGPAWRFATR